MSKSYSFNRYS